MHQLQAEYIYIYINLENLLLFTLLCALYIFICLFFSRDRGSGSVMSSMGKLICYHLGSVAKGSFLITIFKLPRLVLTYIERK
jgi:hypothetical protein